MSNEIRERLQAGLQHHQAGRLQEAQTIYRSILEEQPQQPDALNLLGVVSLQMGNPEEAAALFEKAIESKPNEPEFYNMCGEAYRALHDYDVAINRYEQAIAIKPNFAGAHNNLGNTYIELRRFEDAVACYQKAIAIDPRFPMSHNNLGFALRELGRPEEAIAHHEQALAIMPNYAEAHTSLGNTLQELGRLEEAIDHHKKALAIMPNHAGAHSNLGNALKECGQLEDAMSHFRQAIALQPTFAVAHYNLGIVLDELDRPEEAITSYEKALAIKPDYAEAHHNMANVLDELGKWDDAITHYKQAIAIKPEYAEAHRNLARIRPEKEQIRAIENLLNASSLSEIDVAQCHFALGNIYHSIKDFDKAFEHYREGNARKRQLVTFDSRHFSAYVDSLIATYSRDYFQAVSAAGSDSDLPVFIIGMPRSGTTLIEQIVCSHPEVYGAGELASFGRYEAAIHERFAPSSRYPECMPLHYQSVAPEFSETYLKELRNYSQDAKRITDKMPDNFLRLGLIRTLFPNARLIHCRRDAMDTCTSNYLHYFATGNTYSFDLKELGQYYLDYERLMAHWSSVFADEILDVQYEDLVGDQERISRQLIEHIGLQWHDHCLAFHENKRAIHNFSSMQVRQPIYSSAIGRWKLYQKQLAPLIEILPAAAA